MKATTKVYLMKFQVEEQYCSIDGDFLKVLKVNNLDNQAYLIEVKKKVSTTDFDFMDIRMQTLKLPMFKIKLTAAISSYIIEQVVDNLHTKILSFSSLIGLVLLITQFLYLY